MATTHLQFSGIDANAKYRPLLGKMELSNAKIDYILCEQLYDYIHEIVAFSIIDCNVVDVKNFNKVLSNMKQLKSLSIWCVNEDEEDEEDFSASFKLSSFSETIKHLNINQLNFDEESSISIENCEALCDILEFNKNIRYLEISGALDKSVVPRLFEVLKTNIHFLDISFSDITQYHLVQFCDIVLRNTVCLTFLRLQFDESHCDKKEWDHLCKSLSNSSLKSVAIDFNGKKDYEQILQLFQAIARNQKIFMFEAGFGNDHNDSLDRYFNPLNQMLVSHYYLKNKPF